MDMGSRMQRRMSFNKNTINNQWHAATILKSLAAVEHKRSPGMADHQHNNLNFMAKFDFLSQVNILIMSIPGLSPGITGPGF